MRSWFIQFVYATFCPVECSFYEPDDVFIRKLLHTPNAVDFFLSRLFNNNVTLTILCQWLGHFDVEHNKT